jgi:HSP20 family molecular chaperone IbpA
MSCECNTNTADTTPADEAVAQTRRPAFNVSQTAEAFAVEVFVPGVNRAGVELSVEDEVLTITAQPAATAPEAWRPLRREIPDGGFRLDLHLNAAVNQTGIQATVEDGVLRLTLPKAETVKARRIPVN